MSNSAQRGGTAKTASLPPIFPTQPNVNIQNFADQKPVIMKLVPESQLKHYVGWQIYLHRGEAKKNTLTLISVDEAPKDGARQTFTVKIERTTSTSLWPNQTLSELHTDFITPDQMHIRSNPSQEENFEYSAIMINPRSTNLKLIHEAIDNLYDDILIHDSFNSHVFLQRCLDSPKDFQHPYMEAAFEAFKIFSQLFPKIVQTEEVQRRYQEELSGISLAMKNGVQPKPNKTMGRILEIFRSKD